MTLEVEDFYKKIIANSVKKYDKQNIRSFVILVIGAQSIKVSRRLKDNLLTNETTGYLDTVSEIQSSTLKIRSCSRQNISDEISIIARYTIVCFSDMWALHARDVIGKSRFARVWRNKISRNSREDTRDESTTDFCGKLTITTTLSSTCRLRMLDILALFAYTSFTSSHRWRWANINGDAKVTSILSRRTWANRKYTTRFTVSAHYVAIDDEKWQHDRQMGWMCTWKTYRNFIEAFEEA